MRHISSEPNYEISPWVDLAKTSYRQRLHIAVDASDNTVSMARQHNRIHALENFHKPSTKLFLPSPNLFAL